MLRRLSRHALCDERDVVFLELALWITLVQVPFAIALIALGSFSWWLAVAYWALWGYCFLDRYILMLHCVSHRPLFKGPFRVLNSYIPIVLGAFCGETPETYFAHHLGMHHKEANGAADLSSTMPFRRDSFLAWLRYFGTFLVFGLPLLVRYLRSVGRVRLARRVLVGEPSFWAMVALVGWLSGWQAAFVVFAVPVVIVRTLMMMGNWAQHAFVDPNDSANSYRNSISCINTRYNRRCFNDGYHIVHHLRPALHYTEMPGEFEKNRASYGAADAIVFDGLDYFQVWLCLMTGRHARLARAFVHLPGAPHRSESEVIAFLKSRLEPIPAPELATARA
ncbi:MAG TPA: fatty acid desaturase [Polyangiaceae bacterium]